PRSARPCGRRQASPLHVQAHVSSLINPATSLFLPALGQKNISDLPEAKLNTDSVQGGTEHKLLLSRYRASQLKLLKMESRTKKP
ncbi:MAG: hypothetical protein ACQERT_14895, partial [Thermodesulfobacteriota bacterium]